MCGPTPPRRRDPILAKLAGYLLLPALALAALVGYSEYRFRQLSAAVDADVGTYQRQRWNRTVLRGVAGEGNAATEARRALEGWKGLTDDARDRLAAQLYYGKPLPPDLLELVTAETPRVERLRAATHMSWAMTEMPLSHCADGATPPYPLYVDAALVMLGFGHSQGPQTCLQVATEVIRLGQDLVPGAPLEAASVAMRLASIAEPVIAHCAASASLDDLAQAARDLGVLASQAPSPGAGIELADVCARLSLRSLAQIWPRVGQESPLTRLRRRPALFEAAVVFENPTRWRTITPDRYPQARDGFMQEHELRSRSPLPLVASATADADGWLLDDMRGQAIVRALAVGVATLSERARRKRLPREPTNLTDPSFRDPYNGQPLRYRVNVDGSELSLWSVGENLRDDKGVSDWSTQAPLDVVLHFRLLPLEEGPAGKILSAARGKP